jgi:hypothetical protein
LFDELLFDGKKINEKLFHEQVIRRKLIQQIAMVPSKLGASET